MLILILTFQGSVLKTVFSIGFYIIKNCCKKNTGSISCFDKAMTSHGGPYSKKAVDGFKSLLRVIPIFLFTILYWTLNTQVPRNFKNIKINKKQKFIIF